jgi:hypothetical protein
MISRADKELSSRAYAPADLPSGTFGYVTLRRLDGKAEMAALRDEVTSAPVDAFGQHGRSWACPARSPSYALSSSAS